MSNFIALLTDFGDKDPYVAEVKGKIFSLNPEVKIIDITHHIPSFDVLAGAFCLYTCYVYLPKGTIFVAVIDPGVGTRRHIVLARVGDYWFLAPDNGLLSFFVWEGKINELFFLKENPFFRVSSTFHGRDIFAPLAARLSVNPCPEEIYWQRINVSELKLLNFPCPKISAQAIEARVCYVDKFGNVILNVKNNQLNLKLAQKGVVQDYPLKVIETYSDLEEGAVGLLYGSHGFLELCLKQKSCSNLLQLSSGSKVTIYFDEQKKYSS
ncbi:MAG: SAM-dependent chlorinase/fluorinase [Desulfonauticus sp.]|nr:SAM-dependent chlorinase/fluorinase [Desulfonauticus sp.]